MYTWNWEPPLLINLALQLGAYLAWQLAAIASKAPASSKPR